jgi:lycopene beta-cyclase
MIRICIGLCWGCRMSPASRTGGEEPAADLVIIGGGCAGLSLGMRLAEDPGPLKRVLILEGRSAYSNDRTWCFWRPDSHRFDALVSRSWSKLAVRAAQGEAVVTSSKRPYQMIAADVFYDNACAKIEIAASVRLQLSTRVLTPPVKIGRGWRIETNQGPVSATNVIDTRPSRYSQHDGETLWQSFLGQEVICARPVFDPTRVELMDFAEDSHERLTFTYVLPLTPTRALIENTVFDPAPQSIPSLSQRQAREIKRLCGDAFLRIERTESGVLPMSVRAHDRLDAPGYWRVGLQHGAARPATGYAFQRIQKWADACSASIRLGGGPLGHTSDSALTRAMDGLFLKVLRSHPERGPELFLRLFQGTSPHRLIRFLCDEANPLDRLAVAAALPKLLFLKEVWSLAPGALMLPENVP